MSTLFLNWQEPSTRRWYVIGRLDQPQGPEGPFTFGYTGGVRGALDAGFTPIVSFPSIEQQYTSDEMFALFDNRVLPKNRPEYDDYIKWLSLSPEQATPFAILARSGGTSVSDSLEVFPEPERLDDGTYTFHFFVRGLRHQAEASSPRAEDLAEGEHLLLMPDVQNPFDPTAFALRTAETFRRDMHLLGYLPRYIAGEVQKWSWKEISEATVSVARINPAPAPSHLRILASINLKWPGGEEPFRSSDYELVG